MSTAVAGTKPPPIESLGKAFFTPLLTIPVRTRKPETPAVADMVAPYLRVESGGGSQQEDGILWDVALLLHSYAPNDQESAAEQTAADAVGWGANAQGSWVTLDSGARWWITYSGVLSQPVRVDDPAVDAIRYRAGVMWRVHGKPQG